jgi:hypothetical protein
MQVCIFCFGIGKNNNDCSCIKKVEGGYNLRNYRFLINDQFQANSIAEDLRVQLDINRFNDVNILSVDNRNELLVQVFESSGATEETVETFMQDYQKGIIIE